MERTNLGMGSRASQGRAAGQGPGRPGPGRPLAGSAAAHSGLMARRARSRPPHQAVGAAAVRLRPSGPLCGSPLSGPPPARCAGAAPALGGRAAPAAAHSGHPPGGAAAAALRPAVVRTLRAPLAGLRPGPCRSPLPALGLRALALGLLRARGSAAVLRRGPPGRSRLPVPGSWAAAPSRAGARRPQVCGRLGRNTPPRGGCLPWLLLLGLPGVLASGRVCPDRPQRSRLETSGPKGPALTAAAAWGVLVTKQPRKLRACGLQNSP